MKEIITNLFIGNQKDYEANKHAMADWHIIHACKEPYHRQLLGYSGKGAPKNHPEYYWAERRNRLILNLVDAPDPAYIPQNCIDKTLEYIHHWLKQNKKLLLHCNEGRSRSAGIGLLYLGAIRRIKADQFPAAEQEYRHHYYPEYNPGTGMRGFLIKHWDTYFSSFEQEH